MICRFPRLFGHCSTFVCAYVHVGEDVDDEHDDGMKMVLVVAAFVLIAVNLSVDHDVDDECGDDYDGDDQMVDQMKKQHY